MDSEGSAVGSAVGSALSGCSHHERRVSLAAANRDWAGGPAGGHAALEAILAQVPGAVLSGGARERSRAILAGGAYPPGTDAHALWRETVDVAVAGGEWDRPASDILLQGGALGTQGAQGAQGAGVAAAAPSTSWIDRHRYVVISAVFGLGLGAVWYATSAANRAHVSVPRVEGDEEEHTEDSVPLREYTEQPSEL